MNYEIGSRERLQLLATAIQTEKLRTEKRECEDSLSAFIKAAWHVIEPGQQYIHGWHIDALCEHLEAISDGLEVDGKLFNRLLANIPPGTMKSMTVSVMWPAWEWGPRNMPHLRYVCASHSQNLAIRDSTKMRRLIVSDWYQKRWGDRVKLTSDQNAKTKFENTATGFREACAAGSITGARGDRVIIDDPHSVEGAASDAMRQTTIDWFLEAVPTRVNNPIESAIVVIMQRLHEEDVSGIIVSKQLGYEHLCLPMEFETWRKPFKTVIGFQDPREEEGELLFPERFPAEVVDRDKRVMGPYASAGQFQQTPSPRGGGIIKREWWRTWNSEEAASQGMNREDAFPAMDYIIASLDTAYTEKQENDASALTIWGVWQRSGREASGLITKHGRSLVEDGRDTLPCVMLMNAWEKRLPIHGPEIPRYPGEQTKDYEARAKESWGLVEWVIHSCNRFKIDLLLIESKANGISVAQEIQRLNRQSDWGVRLVNPGNADKVARVYAVQATFSNGIVFAPDRSWADSVINQFEVFPKGAHDDLVDSTTMALKHLREAGLIRRASEVAAELTGGLMHRSPTRPIYDV